MVRKSLHHLNDFLEIKTRISNLSPDSERKWGRMNAAQMLNHCIQVLKVPMKKNKLPKVFIVLKWVGILAKYEMKIFNNGIPHNMPTFKKLIITFDCNFETSKAQLLKTLDDYAEFRAQNKLPSQHQLFGKMTEEMWGFLEYKHLNHHLKQFNV
ncbi:DUF1569 domain-containing protein [Chryseobacterium piscicola]|nr:DUF1569 domain-containing protein [Chryseobacterium piscicola]